MPTPAEEQIATALERATAFVHAKLDAVEEQRLKRTGWRQQIDLLTLPHGDVEPVDAMPGWVEVGWIVRYGEPEYWTVLMELATGKLKVRHVRRNEEVDLLTQIKMPI
jgi:hypothetical protein